MSMWTVTLNGLSFAGGATSSPFTGFFFKEVKDWLSVTESKAQRDPRPNAHGDFAGGYDWREGAVFEFEGGYVGADQRAAEDAVDVLKSALIENIPLRVEVTTEKGTTSRMVSVHKLEIPDFKGRRAFKFTADLVASDARHYGPKSCVSTGLPQAGTGLRFPLGLPGGVAAFTNLAPSLYGATTPVEVRRNTFPDPRAQALLQTQQAMGMGGAGTNANVAGETPNGSAEFKRATVTTAPSARDAGWIINRSTAGSVPAGVPVAISFEIRSSVAFTTVLGTTMYTAGVAGRLVNLGPVTIPANTWTRIAVTVPLTGSENGYYLRTYRSDADPIAQVGDTLDITEIMETAQGAYFDHAISPDLDMTPELVPGGGGASRLIGQHPVGFTDVNCVSVIHEGVSGRELRIIPTGALNTSFSLISIPVAARVSGTVMGVARIDAAQTGVLVPQARRILPRQPDQPSDANANVAGSYPQRRVFASLTSTYEARFCNGAAAGGGDVFWSDIALLTGDYSGPYFGPEMEGETVTVDGTDYRVRVTGGVAELVEMSDMGFFDWGTPGTSGRVTVTNTGTAATEPQITVSGPLPGFEIVEVETGRRLRFDREVLDGSTVELRDGQAWSGGAPVTTFLTSMEWPTVPKGATRTYQFLPTGPTTGTPQMMVCLAPAWW